jgi:hypothetical protein
MQVIGLGPGALGYQYNGALDAARVIIKTEGVRGMYRGLWPNLCASILIRNEVFEETDGVVQ